jgi:general stress protein YciG
MRSIWTSPENQRRKLTMPNQGGSRDQRENAGQQGNKNQDENKRGQQQAEHDKDQRQGGNRGGSGNFANDPERASEAGRKGGKS